MLRRRYANYAYLKPLVLHGNLTIDVTRPAANPGADPKGISRSGPAQSSVALAPPKRSVQRGITSRLEMLAGMPPLSARPTDRGAQATPSRNSPPAVHEAESGASSHRC